MGGGPLCTNAVQPAVGLRAVVSTRGQRIDGTIQLSFALGGVTTVEESEPAPLEVPRKQLRRLHWRRHPLCPALEPIDE